MEPRRSRKGPSRWRNDTEAMGDTPGINVRSYPRKRVAIACDVCRTRKTRCDAAKPSCSFCSETGIECRYTGPSPDDRRVAQESSDYIRTLQRLEDIQSTLDAVATAVGVGCTDLAYTLSPSLQDGNHQLTSPASHTLATRRSPVSRMPNLFVYKAWVTPHSADHWSYDCTRDFFISQMKAEEDLCYANKTCNLQIDLSKPHLCRLQRSFVENVLKWLPLFDHQTATQRLQQVKFGQPQDDTPAACLVLLMYANGALAADNSLYAASPIDLAGFEYYARAMKALRQLPSSGEDLCILQCYVLSSIYLLIAMRPLEAWKNIRQASQTCIVLLKAGVTEQRAEYKEIFNRIYWICYVLESELEISLDLPTSDLRAFGEVVELPTSHYEEEGMYNLLALSSLRKLMIEVVDTVGLRSPSANYAPVITIELRNQIDHWYRRLPQCLHFPSGHSLLFDIRKAYLRCMYYALIAVAFWPFVATFKDITHDGSHVSLDGNDSRDEDHVRMRQGANECLAASRNYLRVADEILTQKTLVSHMIIRSYFTTAMILLLIHPVVADPAATQTTEDASLILHALHNLGHWNMVPFLKRPLDKITRIAQLKGLIG